MSTQKQLAKELYSMTWPMLLGVLSLMSFLLADSIFISRLGVEPLAVMSFSIPLYQLVIGIQVGIGIATTALISQLLGANKECDASELGGTIVLNGTLTVLILCTSIWIFRHPLLSMLGADESLIPLVEEFWPAFLLSAFLGALLYFGYSICRAHGNTKRPGLVMTLTSLLNIALDPLFIFYFELGLKGAAYATVASYSVGLALVYPTIFKNTWMTLERNLKNYYHHCISVSDVAIPAIASQLLPALSSMLATKLVSSYGTVSVAAWGAGIRLEYFLLILILALTMSLPPMIGRLYGARNFEQIDLLVKVAAKFILLWQVVIGAFAILCHEPIARLLGDSEQVASALGTIILMLPISYAPLGICMIIVSACNAIGAPKRALAISFSRLFVCFIPCLALGSWLGGFEGLIAGAAAGNLFAGALAWRLYKQYLNSQFTMQEQSTA